MRVIVYELRNGTEEVFEMACEEEEAAERQVADIAVRQGDCVAYRFEWREEANEANH